MTFLRHLYYLFTFLCLFGCSKQTNNLLTIAASANLQLTLKELVTAFEHQTNIKSTVVLASSGKLTAQIEAGAPFDIFLSANKKYPKYLLSKNNTYSTPKTYALASLSIFSTTFNSRKLNSLLTSEKVTKIAIPNPKTAPYGQIAKEYLQKTGIYNTIKHKLVFGENVTQTNQFVISGAASIGFTALATLNKNMYPTINYQKIPDSLYTPLEQQSLVLKQKKEAIEFEAFLQSNEAQTILKKYGYGSIQ